MRKIDTFQLGINSGWAIFLILSIVFVDTFNGLILFSIILIGILLFLLREKSDSLRSFTASIFLTLGIMGLFLVNHYTFPNQKDGIFDNSDYHVLEHLGFDYRDSIKLVNDKDSLYALWDDKKGVVSLKNKNKDTAQLHIQDFYEPFYVQESQERPTHFKLVNNSYNLDISTGFQVKESGTSILHFEIADALTNEISKARYRIGVNAADLKEIEFDKKIFQGYPFTDLLAQGNFNNLGQLLELFEGSYLIRAIHRPKSAGLGADNALYFFPGRNFASNPNIQISNGQQSLANADLNTAFTHDLPHDRRFYVGLGKTATEKLYLHQEEDYTNINDLHTKLVFDFPQKFRLKNDRKNLLFISSSLDEVIQNSLDGGYYFPLFENSLNKNHCMASIRYNKGSPEKSISFHINDQYDESLPQTNGSLITASSDEAFFLSSKNKESNLRWIFQVTNLRESNALTQTKLYGFIILYIFLVLVVINVVGTDKISLVEIAAYIAIFVFLMVRIILQWRISTFVPIEDIGKYEYEDTLRSIKWFHFTVIWTVAFFVIRLGIFFFRTTDWFSKKWETITAYWKKVPFWKYMLVYVALALTQFVTSGSLSRIFNIFLPVSLYFLVSILNFHNRKDTEKLWGFEPFQIFNTLIAVGWLAIADSGFGIIFFLFVCLKEFLKVFLTKSPSRKHMIKAVIAAILFFGVIRFGSNLISNAIDNKEITYIVLLIIALGILAGLLVIIGRVDRPKKLGFRLFSGLFLIGILAGGILGYHHGFPDKLSRFNYVKYRAKIHHTPIDSLIQQEKFKSSEVNQILQAGQNQWFINAYLKKDTAIEDEAKKRGYFSLKPHFNKGSGYTTQTRDVVLTRYIIAEHSEVMVLGLIALFMLLIVLYFQKFYAQSSYSRLGFDAIVLLFTIGFFVWLTATNRFIFFGQDFPFLSITSKLTLFLPFLLFLILIISNERLKEGELIPRKRTHKYALVIPILGIVLTGYFLKNQNNILAENLFNIDPTIKVVKERVDFLNKRLGVYQDSLVDTESQYYRPNFDPEKISAFYAVPDSLNNFISGFNEYLGNSQLSTNVNPENISDRPFVSSIYNYFSKDLKDKNNPSEILHLIVKNGVLQLSINEQYYLIQPPEDQQNRWLGHLYAAKKDLRFELVNTANDKSIPIANDAFISDFDAITDRQNIKNHQLTVIPGGWLEEKEMALLLSRKRTATKEEQGKFKILNNATNYSSYEQKIEGFALKIIPNDFVNVYDYKDTSKQYKLVREENNYLMRNLWLNGKQRFFYPLGEDFIWAYNYANAAQTVYASKTFSRDSLRVSIDYDLTKNISGIVKEYAKRRRWSNQKFSVSILDGNGRIRAIVDHVQKSRLNPNDLKGLLKFRKESYAIQRPSSGRDEKGNLNLFSTRIGPGSSIKPIMYAATTSQYNFNWESLTLNDMTDEMANSLLDGEGRVSKFGGKSITPWKLQKLDKIGLDNKDYMIRSSNMYHSLVMFLGSYTKSTLQQQVDNILSPLSKKEPYFPSFNYRGEGPFTFNPAHWPSSSEGDKDYFGNTNSILAEGLRTNFNLNVSWPKEDNRANHVNIDAPTGPSIYDNNYTEFKSFSYPEVSSFIHDDREQRSSFNRSIKQSTLGGFPVVVTPIKMAEMGGRLLSMNKAFSLSLDDSGKPLNFIPFEVDKASWGDAKTYYENFYYPELIQSLEDVIKEGTLQSLSGLLKEDTKYHYYAKTGTINFETRRNNRASNKLLLFVISQNDLAEINYEQLPYNKLYVFYFTCYECGNQPSGLLKSIINEVEENNSGFKKYFNVETN
ncbi:SLC5/6 family protein [Spongiimicrobium salis]|uniref:hypothetical protein n=1 Tax=Spongiimicrobium salis TaxID=1667022 RepID=UPI00374D8DE4